MSLEKNMDVKKFNPISIHALNDDCLKSVFTVFNANTQPKTCFYNDICYEDILSQMQLVRTCNRFRDMFVHSFWISMDKHLTLRPHQLYRTLGPLNYTYYVKVMRCQLKKLEIQEYYLQWFLDIAGSEGIYSFPGVETCILTNTCLKPINEEDIRKITLNFLPSLESLSLSTKIKCEDFVHLIALKEFRLRNHSPMDYSYFKNICDTLENIRVLDISSPLDTDKEFDGDLLSFEALPKHIEILHLNVSMAEVGLPAILNLKKLRKLVLTVLNTQRARDSLEAVNTILLTKVEDLTGFGVNESLENVLLVWDVPNEIPQSSKVKKFIYSGSESIPLISVFERFVDLNNISQLCLRCCFGLKNEIVLQFVELAKNLQHIDISKCYSIDVGKLLTEMLGIRQQHNNANQMGMNETLFIYNVDDDMENQFHLFWKSQNLVKNGNRCPIELHSNGFVFDFD